MTDIKKDIVVSSKNCVLCNRSVPIRYQEKHHLIPACKKGKETEIVCIDCGDQIHHIFTNKEIRDIYNTIEKLKANSRVQKWINWIKKKNTFGICMKIKKRK